MDGIELFSKDCDKVSKIKICLRKEFLEILEKYRIEGNISSGQGNSRPVFNVKQFLFVLFDTHLND